MRFERISLGDENVYLDAYIADRVADFTRRALLVIPGGGYNNVCSEREGEPIAMAFLPHGYNAFVLHYTVGRKKPFPQQLIEVGLAVKHIKDHAKEYGIRADELFLIGFSAGGHLAASGGVLWDLAEVETAIGCPHGYNKPRGVMLIYPVISAEHHGFSFANLLCDDAPSKKREDACSIEKHVRENSAPAFIMHSSNDQIVDVKNSLVLASAYKDAGVLFEMHIYPDAPHGVALGNEITRCGVDKWVDPAIAKWVEHAALWADGVCKKQ